MSLTRHSICFQLNRGFKPTATISGSLRDNLTAIRATRFGKPGSGERRRGAAENIAKSRIPPFIFHSISHFFVPFRVFRGQTLFSLRSGGLNPRNLTRILHEGVKLWSKLLVLSKLRMLPEIQFRTGMVFRKIRLRILNKIAQDIAIVMSIAILSKLLCRISRKFHSFMQYPG